MAGQFVSAVQTLVSRNLDPVESAVITFGVINGGTTRNVICNQVHLDGILRCLNPDVRKKMLVRVEEMASGIAKAFGGSCVFKRKDSQAVTMNDPALASLVENTARSMLGQDRFATLPAARLGCETFARYGEVIPATFWVLGTGNAEKDTQHAWHSDHFNIDEDALPTGVAMQAALVYRYLEEHAQ